MWTGNGYTPGIEYRDTFVHNSGGFTWRVIDTRDELRTWGLLRWPCSPGIAADRGDYDRATTWSRMRPSYTSA